MKTLQILDHQTLLAYKLIEFDFFLLVFKSGNHLIIYIPELKFHMNLTTTKFRLSRLDLFKQFDF